MLDDYICRHIMITNMDGKKSIATIHNIQPVMHSTLPKYYNKEKSVFVRIEDTCMVMSIAQSDYALNPLVLRAVMNNYAIDMSEPCTEYRHKQLHGWYTPSTVPKRKDGKHKSIGELISTTDYDSESSEAEGDGGSSGANEKRRKKKQKRR